MSTIPADASLIAPKRPAAFSAPRRLPRLMGWALSAVVAGAMWSGAVALLRLVF